MSKPEFETGMQGKAVIAGLYLYFSKKSFWHKYLYFASYGHIEDGFWLTQKQVRQRVKI